MFGVFNSLNRNCNRVPKLYPANTTNSHLIPSSDAAPLNSLNRNCKLLGIANYKSYKTYNHSINTHKLTSETSVSQVSYKDKVITHINTEEARRPQQKLW